LALQKKRRRIWSCMWCEEKGRWSKVAVRPSPSRAVVVARTMEEAAVVVDDEVAGAPLVDEPMRAHL
jgi:hypothetical protein